MANAVTTSTMYVDSTGSLNARPTLIYAISVTATTSNAVLELADATSDTKKIELRVATSGTSELFHFRENPLYFAGGVQVDTATNVVATLIYNNT